MYRKRDGTPVWGGDVEGRVAAAMRGAELRLGFVGGDGWMLRTRDRTAKQLLLYAGVVCTSSLDPDLER